jgi:hypothetical protein
VTQPIRMPGADDRSQVCIAQLGRMTGVIRKDFVVTDQEFIKSTLSNHADERGVPVDIWAAHDEVPWWDERKSPHNPRELFEAGRRLATRCDGLVTHAFLDGSGSLGHLTRGVIEAPHHPPVLVVAHESEALSKAWEGQETRHRNLKFERFESSMDLCNKVTAWLEDGAWNRILGGPARRHVHEGRFAAQSEGLKRAWTALHPSARAWYAGELQLSEADVAKTIGDPIELASISGADLTVLLGMTNAYESEVRHSAEQHLDAGELRAWQSWAVGKSLGTNAYRVLEMVVVEAQRRNRRPAADLHHRGGWDKMYNLWQESR